MVEESTERKDGVMVVIFCVWEGLFTFFLKLFLFFFQDFM